MAHWALRHREDDLVSTMQRLAELDEPGDLPVAIETRRGLRVGPLDVCLEVFPFDAVVATATDVGRVAFAAPKPAPC